MCSSSKFKLGKTVKIIITTTSQELMGLVVTIVENMIFTILLLFQNVLLDSTGLMSLPYLPFILLSKSWSGPGEKACWHHLTIFWTSCHRPVHTLILATDSLCSLYSSWVLLFSALWSTESRILCYCESKLQSSGLSGPRRFLGHKIFTLKTGKYPKNSEWVDNPKTKKTTGNQELWGTWPVMISGNWVQLCSL